MTAHHAIADVAALVGEPARAAILLALLDGRALPAGELARAAGLSNAAASLHLGKLTQGNLLTVRKEGRHRYYQLAHSDVAHALEALGVIATHPPPGRSLSPQRSALRTSRTCYDHLAGELAVGFCQLLERERLLRVRDTHNFEVTPRGARWLEQALEIDVAALSARRRPLARRCLDWTERRPHLSGALGAAVLDRFVSWRWIRKERASRAVHLTTRGQTGLLRLGLRV